MIWLKFTACALLIGLGGYQLSRQGDVIARRTGLSGSWIGLALLATVTSLPELATGITSVTIAQAADVAVGDALGSCQLNLAFLVLMDLVHRREPIWHKAGQGHVLAAAFGVILLGFTSVALFISQIPSLGRATSLSIASLGFSFATPVVLALYLVAMRTVFTYERAHYVAEALSETDQAAFPRLKQAIVRFAVAAVVVVGAGWWLPFIAVELAGQMGWNRSFVGSMFVAFATSMPELAVTFSALRLGAVDMAVGNLLGSNLFNVAIIAVDDLFYRAGPLLADVSPVHAVTAASAVLMTGLAMVGLFFRPQARVLHGVGWVSLGLLAMYLLNAYVLYLHGD